MRLQDKVAIVTGGAAGIGRAICELFAQEGARVLVADIDDAGGQETVRLIKSAGGEASYALRLYDAIVEAAPMDFGQVESVTDSQWQQVLGVNVLGPAYCVKHVLPVMRAAGGGSIVNIASISSFIAQPAFVPYNTSKGALLQLTRCLAMDLAPYNIRVNAVCPGAVLTQATERHRRFVGADREEFLKQAASSNFLKRFASPREIAYGVLFLASDESSFVTGAPLIMDGGTLAQ